MKKILTAVVAMMTTLTASAVDDNVVLVTYDGTSATVEVASNISSYITYTTSGAHVSIVQSESVSSSTGEIIYTLTGSSSDGQFYMEGSYKATVLLNGLTLTNASGPAINIQNGKRIKVSANSGTENTLTDAASGDWKGCLVCKGHTEFKGRGTLNISGLTAHAVWSKEYVEVKNITLNITGSVKDAINCNQYFLMEGGTLNITSAGDDGIQVSLKDETSTGTTTDHEDEDSGNFYMTDGTLTISGCTGYDIKTYGTISVTGGTLTNSGTTKENDVKILASMAR